MQFSDLVGKTLISFQETNDEIAFTDSDGVKYKLYHDQDCCESVTVEDVNGSPEDILNSPLTLAEESTENEYDTPKVPESETWTFYRLATVKGYLNIRFYGYSNGYYSEKVDFSVDGVKQYS